MSNWTEADLRAFTQRRLKDEQRTRTEIYEAANTSLGAVVSRRPERNKVQALDGGGKERRQRKARLVVRVTLITVRRKELDWDSAVFALKPLRDAIAASLGLDDEDARIKWECGQQLTSGETGVIVKIESL